MTDVPIPKTDLFDYRSGRPLYIEAQLRSYGDARVAAALKDLGDASGPDSALQPPSSASAAIPIASATVRCAKPSLACPNMKDRENDTSMSYEHYDCKVCGGHIALDYDEMR